MDKKYKNPPKIILTKYKVLNALKKSFKLKEISIIIILIKTLTINNSKVFNLINKNNIEKDPTKADNKRYLNFIFFFKIIAVDSISKKSKEKFRKKTKST